MAKAAALIALLVACGGSAEPTFTQSVCPTSDPPTYDSFGRAFMEAYCTSCHDAAKTGAMRDGAPATIDFDTLARLRVWTSQIDQQAAIGPRASNRFMPPAGSRMPSDDDRRRLGEFIACEVAR